MFRLMDALMPKLAMFADGDAGEGGVFGFPLDGGAPAPKAEPKAKPAVEKDESDAQDDEKKDDQAADGDDGDGQDGGSDDNNDDGDGKKADAPADKKEKPVKLPEGDDKDLSAEEISKLKPADKAFYYKWKTEKQKRQRLEGEIDEYARADREKLRKKVGKAPAEEKGDDAQDVPQDDVFEGKSDDDLLTVADVRKMLLKKETVEKSKVEQQTAEEKKHTEAVRAFQADIDEQEKVFAEVNPDYIEAREIYDKVQREFPGIGAEFIQITRKAFNGEEGADPIEFVYKIGKRFKKMMADADEGKPAGKTQGEKDNKTNVTKMLNNAAKRKTSASLGGTGQSSGAMTHEELENMEPEELASYLVDLSDKNWNAYRAIPKRIRDRAMG